MTPTDRPTLDYAAPQTKRSDTRAAADLRMILHTIIALAGAAVAGLASLAEDAVWTGRVLKGGLILVAVGWIAFIVECLRGAGSRDG
jgi:hypothetical protein